MVGDAASNDLRVSLDDVRGWARGGGASAGAGNRAERRFSGGREERHGVDPEGAVEREDGAVRAERGEARAGVHVGQWGDVFGAGRGGAARAGDVSAGAG